LVHTAREKNRSGGYNEEKKIKPSEKKKWTDGEGEENCGLGS
jgi:hypothetical protein